MTERIPSIGRIVHYTLRDTDAEQINRRRTHSGKIAEMAKDGKWPAGAQAHIGNEVQAGEAFPMLIVAVWSASPDSCVNGQVFLDGNDSLWATSVSVGEGPGTWRWPV